MFMMLIWILLIDVKERDKKKKVLRVDHEFAMGWEGYWDDD